ncbi:methyltransferase domain-containing protein [Xanthovirga aplysinae]|uniref:methyltransferase domain-containing protein n=1 Tax=Xanthovirga aplysinae TaxID=2529853 RepID=UPI0012BCC8B4|nr:methyltransferase domain-containing protein [Xanthovirga aplysinae]MTI29997.1 class I SAM-dependent methyltransferase [Xanthovirga aplysinae]
MATLLEQTLSFKENKLLSKALKVQAKAFGILDIPFLLQILDNHPINKVLDIGTGEGSFILEIAKRKPEIDFVAMDHNKELIKQATEAKEKLNIKNINFIKHRFGSRFYSKKFDLVFTRFCLEHSSSPQTFVNQVFNQLNKRGVFAIIEEYWFDTGLDDEIWQKFRKNNLKTFKMKFRVDPYTPRHLTKWLHEAGFKNIKSKIAIYSPNTIGIEYFCSLILNIAFLGNQWFPDIWKKKYLKKLEQWIEKVIYGHELDPFITCVHATAIKKEHSFSKGLEEVL